MLADISMTSFIHGLIMYTYSAKKLHVQDRPTERYVQVRVYDIMVSI